MVSTIKYNKCLCCGSAAINKVLDCKDYTVSQELFEVWACTACTFRFTQNVPVEADIHRYYQSSDYISHSNTKAGLINKLYHYVRNITLKTKQQLLVKATGLKQGVLLDIGAGTGAFAYTMQQAGWQVTGLEPDDTARANAQKDYDLQLQDLSNLHRLENNTFDVITLWHVLEHVHELHQYLEKFYTLLKSDGRLIVAVPNYTSHDASVYKKYWAAYDVPRHLYHFSPKSIEILLKEKSFAVEVIKPMWFDSFYVSMLSEKYKNGKNNLPGALWTGLVSNIKTVLNTKKCSSIIYVIKKK